jgi:hypothetical protein
MRKKARKRMIIIIGIFIFLPLIVCCCTIGVWYGKNVQAETTVKRLVREIELFENRNGRLPAELDEIDVWFTLSKRRFCGVFKRNELLYQVSDDEYRLYYYMNPLGPFEGYDSVSGKWFYEE